MTAFSPAEDARFYGFKDFAFLCARTVTGLFPLEAVAGDDGGSIMSRTEGHREEDPVEELAEWVAYVLYRTILPPSTIFHALHLLLRLSATGSRLPDVFESSSSTAPSNVVHYRLLLAAFVLSTAYSMDDAYSNRSWAIASRLIFPLSEIDRMELSLLQVLGWRLVEEGERMDDILARYLDDFEASMLEREELRQEEEEALRLQKVAARRQAKMRQVFGPEVVSASLRHPEEEQDVRRLAKVHKVLGSEVGILYASTPTQFAFVVQDIPIDDIPPSSSQDGTAAAALPSTPLLHRKMPRKRTTSAGGSQHEVKRARPSPAAPWAAGLHPSKPSPALAVGTVAIGTPAMASSTAADACQCALNAGGKTVQDDRAPPPPPCRWCLLRRAKAKLAHHPWAASSRPHRVLGPAPLRIGW